MRNESGQATVIELALILPVLLAFLFGVVDYGRVMHARNTLVNAARAGARTAVLTPGLLPQSSTAVGSGSSTTAVAVAGALAPLQNSDGTVPPSITYQISLANAGGRSVTGAAQPGNQVTVTVNYGQFPMITPLNAMLAMLINGQPQGSNQLSISGQAVMRYD
ncbi:hypothetical protein GMSM_23470 [Geomonas sp. Red276]